MTAFNPLLNQLIRDRNAMVVEDSLVDLLAEMVKAIVRLESPSQALGCSGGVHESWRIVSVEAPSYLRPRAAKWCPECDALWWVSSKDKES